MKKKIFSLVLILIIPLLVFCGCDESSSSSANPTKTDIENTQDVADNLSNNQATPTDLDYSLERYNLIRRAYWVNGQREKAMSLPCAITRPLGYIVLFSSSGAVIGRFIVDGKVSSLNSFLTPSMIQEYQGSAYNGVGYITIETELPDIDGSYGENVNGIFFFTTDGKYIEWTGDFLFSDIPFSVDDPILKTE